MISKWFSGSLTPWNYMVSLSVILLTLAIILWTNSDPGFWIHQFQTSTPPMHLVLGLIGLTLFIWSALDQFLIRKLKSETGYSLLFPSWVICFLSFHQQYSILSGLSSHLFLVIFVGLWILFQHQESKLTLLASGLSAGLVALQFPALIIIGLFGLISLWIWNSDPLRNSLVWILGCLLPAYYWMAYHQFSFQHWPEMPKMIEPEIWLALRPTGQIPWHLILVLSAAILGFILQWPWFGPQNRILRQINQQWIGLALCCIPVLIWLPGDPWRILAALTPLLAWWINDFLQWKDGFWFQDTFLLLWLVLYIWGF